MKRLVLIAIGGGILAFSLVTGASARAPQQAASATATATSAVPGTPTPTAGPVQGPKLNVVLSVDTVQGAGGNPAPAAGCSQTNLFRQGQVVVFRMWGVNVKLGGAALTPKNVKSASLNIPGVSAPIALTYGAHGTVSFWSAPWNTKGYALGVVDFSIVVKTKAFPKLHVKAMTATYTQTGFATPSRLTITP